MKITYGLKKDKITLDLKKLLGDVYYGHTHKLEMEFTAIPNGVIVEGLKVISIKECDYGLPVRKKKVNEK